MDYSYRLFFPHGRTCDVLRALSSFQRPDDSPAAHSCVVTCDGQDVTLPFKDMSRWPLNRPDTDALPPVRGDERIVLGTNFTFPSDSFLIADADGIPSRHLDDGTISVGFIYLSISSWSPELVVFDLTAATSGMSRLFEDSPSIRARFVSLLEDRGGICGVFDDEDKTDHVGYLLWPNPPEDKWEGVARRIELIGH